MKSGASFQVIGGKNGETQLCSCIKSLAVMLLEPHLDAGKKGGWDLLRGQEKSRFPPALLPPSWRRSCSGPSPTAGSRARSPPPFGPSRMQRSLGGKGIGEEELEPRFGLQSSQSTTLLALAGVDGICSAKYKGAQSALPALRKSYSLPCIAWVEKFFRAAPRTTKPIPEEERGARRIVEEAS